ncbi:sn-glycerol 3-phosphate transport system ATP-binding protein [Mycolicibacterium sp. BK634]|uniref:ABC transporter ATP-binding protein n=1 Tax=Mycobacteriaceae TaxID=1762 RepID=UPI001062374D|nr:MULTISPECIES: sn-glycerol-3-phosphate ABC transporter ATP-binding protein UgpC [Mycobacteriaceae]MBB3751471.1 sn-glycerol 3-phosphate transport system ATP-binding protein [Mycolicibacterium sp. BK634]TDO12000.1 sn-glycerol 3-phosphate transport system ATP-binding protein [Mycobacterium sp. BK086]
MAEVEFRDVTRRYPGGVVALNSFNLTIADGEFLILVGPSGCGKSTALRLLAGLDKPTSGEIRIGGAVVNGLAPGERDIAMVFQNYALYPHMSVYRNLAFGLRQRKTPRAEVDRRVRETAALLEIDTLLDRKPGQLSGGQRQRVAMGRALVRQPQAFLLDEPLSNLDAKLRNQVRGDLKRLHRELPVTSIYVTHDQVEAMTLGDRLCVMAGGEIQQIGTPDEIYNRPANTFVAAFMGSPPMNLIAADVRSGMLHVGDGAVTTVSTPDGPVTVGVRPEHLRLRRSHAEGLLPARVDFVEPLGSHVLVTALVDISDTETARIIVHAPAGTDLPAGAAIGLEMPPEQTYFFDADTGSARASRERVTL